MEPFPYTRANVLTEIYKLFGANEEDATPAQKIRAEICYLAHQNNDRKLVLKMLKEAEHDEKWEGED